MVELTKRQREILDLLIHNKKYFLLDELAEIFNVSKRTIQNDLNYIENTCVENGIEIIKKPSQGIKIDFCADVQARYEKLIKNSMNRFLDKNERIDFIIINLLCKENSTYQKVADELRVSRQTIINDFKAVKDKLYEFNINIITNRNQGISIDADEMAVRNTFMNYAIKYDLRKYINNLDKAEHLLTELKDKLNLDFADYNKTLSVVGYCLDRNESGHFINNELATTVNNDEYNTIISSYINEKKECKYICNLLLNERLNQLTKLNEIEYDNEAQQITEYLVKSLIKYQPIVDIEGLDHFVAGLTQHIRCAMYRVRNKLSVKNEFAEQIRYTMPVLYAFTAKKMKEIQSAYNVEFDDSEISFITMYLATIYEENNQHKELSILLVCSYGIASSAILKSRLVSKIPGINIIGSIDVKQYYSYIKEHKVDIVISTVELESNDIPLVVIKPLPDNNDILEINNKIDEFYFEEMSNKLIIQNQDEQDECHCLSEYINIENIQICNEKIGWREAIHLAAKPLLSKELINQHYVDEMINAVDKYGTYMMLTENTAFVHAGKEDGIKENCTSMLLLKNRIGFGDSDVKKIDNIVVLGIKNHDETELLNVVYILGKKENIEKLKSNNISIEDVLKMHS